MTQSRIVILVSFFFCCLGVAQTRPLLEKKIPQLKMPSGTLTDKKTSAEISAQTFGENPQLDSSEADASEADASASGGTTSDPSTSGPLKSDTSSTNASPPDASKTGAVKVDGTHWGLTGNISLFETWVLTKYGLTAFYSQDPAWIFEVEYMRGSLGFGYFGFDIGRIKEERISLLARSFSNRKSFHFMYGLFHNKIEVGLGEPLLKVVNPWMRPGVDRITVSMAGVTWGMGSRWWTRKGYILGVDWFVLNVPFAVLQEHTPYLKQSNSQKDRNEVKDSLNWIKRFPSAGILKIQVGMQF